MRSTTQPIDDEIDLLEFAGALKRRWRWLLGCTLSGLAIGGVVALKQPAQVKLSMFIDLSKGPQSPLSGKPVESARYLWVNYQPKYQRATAILLFRSLIASGQLTSEQQNAIEIVQPSDRTLASDQLLEVKATVSSTQASTYQTLFKALHKDLLLKTEKDLLAADRPSQPGFVQVQRPVDVPDYSGRALALGGLAGLAVGVGASLLADRLANRVFSAVQLQQLLGYPVLGMFPGQRWVDPVVQVELGQLIQQLDPNFNWKVLSIANQHPCVEPLASALKLSAAAPLLTHKLNAFSVGQPGGVLLVVEPGFNSMFALQEARRTLELLPGLKQVGLVLILDREFPELVGLGPE